MNEYDVLVALHQTVFLSLFYGITVIYKCFLEDWSDIVEQQMVNYPVTEL